MVSMINMLMQYIFSLSFKKRVESSFYPKSKTSKRIGVGSIAIFGKLSHVASPIIVLVFISINKIAP